MVIRDLQTGEEFEGPDGTTFDTARYEVVSTAKPKESSWSDYIGPVVRYGTPVAGALLGPAGMLGGMATAGLVGAGSSAAADMIEGKGFDGGKAVLGGALNAAGGVLSRPLGALAGVAGSKLGLTGKTAGKLAPNALHDMAKQAKNVPGLIGPRSAAAAETIDDLLTQTGGSVPLHAPGLQPSAELIRKGIPYKQPGGKEMYGALRESARTQAPAYDKKLSQYAATHELLDMPGLRELLTMGMLGGAGGYGMGVPGGLAALLPRLLRSANVAPPARGIQAGMSGLSSYLGDE